MPRQRNDSSLIIRGKEFFLRLGHFGRMNRVSFAMQHNGRYIDRWPLRKLLFNCFQIWISDGRSMAISIRMDYNVDKVRIIEAAGRFVKKRISKLPVRTPKFPQQTTDITPVPLKTGSTSFGLKVPLVPTFVFPLGRRGLSIESKAFDVIATDRYEPSNFPRPQSRGSASRSGAPVVAHQDRLLKAKNIDQSFEIMSKSRLLA